MGLNVAEALANNTGSIGVSGDSALVSGEQHRPTRATIAYGVHEQTNDRIAIMDA